MASKFPIAALLVAALAAGARAQEFDGPAPVAWRWAESASAPPSGAPLVEGDDIFVAVGGRIYGLNRENGNQKWRFPVAEPLEGNFRSGVVMAGTTVVAAADSRIVYCVDRATGTLKWQHASEAPITGAPVYTGDSVVFATTSNTLVALDATTGTPRWDKPLETKNGVYPNLSAWQGNVVYMTNAPAVVSVSVATQRENWRVGLRNLSASSQAVSLGDTIYIASGNYLSAVRGATGGRKGEVRLDKTLAFGPGVGEEGVAVVSNDGYVFTFDLNLKPIFRAGIPLDSLPVSSPAFIGKLAAIPTTNGAVNVFDPRSGDVVYNYVVPPLFRTASGAEGGGASPEAATPTFVAAAGPPAGAGQTMLLLLRDGSLVAFDKQLGVDLTPPTVKMVWPTPGEQISGAAPLELAFYLTDASSGVNPSSVKVFVGGKEYEGVYNRDGFLSVKIVAGGKNAPLQDGRQEAKVTATDWLGNQATFTIDLSVDNTLGAIGMMPRSAKQETGVGVRGGGKRGG